MNLRKHYSHTLRALAYQMRLLERLQYREYRLTERSSGGRSGMSASPTLIDMHAADLLAETEITLQDIAAQVGLWGDWRKLLHVMHNKLGDLSTLPTVNWDIRQLEAYLARIRAVTDRSPHKPFIGICTNCGRNIYADPQETLQQCACKHITRLDQIRETTRIQWERMHITTTPAGAARFCTEQTGKTITASAVKHWRDRNLIQVEKTDSKGIYQWPIGQLLRRAESLERNNHA